MATIPNYLLIVFVFLFSSIHANTKPTRQGVTLQLFHRFSPSLPFHKTENFEKFLERNEQQFINQRMANFQQESVDVQLVTPIAGSQHLFFVNISIGEPPITQYLAMDIGSRYIWVIGDTNKREFKYSPDLSLTHRYIKCDDTVCSDLPYGICNENGNCMYQTRYGDGQTSQGYIGYDRVVFSNSVVKNVIMGNSDNEGHGSLFDEKNFYGVFGLSPGFPSFVHWLSDLGANKFSYYINGKVTDDIHPYARLTLGDMADVQGGNTTPLKVDGVHYRVSLESISLGEEILDIDPKVFAYNEHDSGTGIIMDTGTIQTWLVDEAYDRVLAKVATILTDEKGFDIKMNNKRLCFYGSVEEVTKTGFPLLSFNFARGASLELDEDDLFIKTGENSFCMTVMRSSRFGPTLSRLTIIGLTAQQDYIMGYDLENQQLSMELSNL